MGTNCRPFDNDIGDNLGQIKNDATGVSKVADPYTIYAPANVILWMPSFYQAM
jgi:hypothetical protein